MGKLLVSWVNSGHCTYRRDDGFCNESGNGDKSPETMKANRQSPSILSSSGSSFATTKLCGLDPKGAVEGFIGDTGPVLVASAVSFCSDSWLVVDPPGEAIFAADVDSCKDDDHLGHYGCSESQTT